MTMSNKVWLITGATSGLGLEMALCALRAGHRVIGTGRNTSKAMEECPEFSRLGGKWLKLDLTQPNAQTVIESAVAEEEALAKGRANHWVVVNNAGGILIGAVEDMSEDQISQYLQLNLFGYIRVWKALLPVLRRHGQGTLVSLSSLWGFVPKCESMVYSAVKAATASLTESYAALLEPFDVRAVIIEPGGFRTSFPGNSAKADGGIAKDYRQQISSWANIVDEVAKDRDIVKGSPSLFGERVLEAVEGSGAFEKLWQDRDTGKPLRVQLGSDCYSLYGARLKDLQKSYESMVDIAKSTDVEE